MKYFLPIILFTVFGLSRFKAQCTPMDSCHYTFYPNTITNFTAEISESEHLYLTGPNTVVYDTTRTTYYSRIVFVNPGTTYYSKIYYGNVMAEKIYVKNGGTVVIKQNGNYSIWYENTGTSITNMSPGTNVVHMSSCSSISMSTINCAVGFDEMTIGRNVFEIYPNPTSFKIKFNFLNSSCQFVDVKILNQLGEIVIDKKQWPVSENEMSLTEIVNGTYFIEVSTALGKQTKKLIVLQ
jgi:hypothetical protein